MTFTYAPPNAAGVFATTRDEVRLLIGDTKQVAASLADEEIAYFVVATRENGADRPRLAAALAARQQADRYEVQAGSQIKVGPFAVDRDYGAIAAQLRSRADELEGGGAMKAITPVVPMVSNAGAVFSLGMTSPGTFYADEETYRPAGRPSVVAPGPDETYEGGTYL